MKRKLQITSLLFLIFSLQLKAQTNLNTAVDFTATDIHGQEINLFQILDGGQYVLIDFFFTSCVPCQNTVSSVKEAYEKLGCNQYEVFFMEVSPTDNNAKLTTWVNNYGIEYPTIGKEGGGNTICSDYGISLYPTVILIAPNREIVKKNIYPSSYYNILYELKPFGINQHDCGNTNPEPDCDPVTNVQASVSTENNNMVNVTWSAPSNETERTYTVTRDGVEIATELTETTYTDQNVVAGEYDYCVKVVYVDCSSEPACVNITGINNELASTIKIYPNPANNVINIEGDIKNIEIYNSLGQVVKTNIKNEQIDVSSLTSGVYHLVLKGADNSRIVEKVIIAK